MSKTQGRVPRWRGLTAVLILLQAVLYGTAASAEDRVQIGYEYATWLGTGGYRVGERDLFILRLPFYKRLRESTAEDFGARLLLPVSVGSLDADTLVSDDVQTLTFIPGIELDFQVSPPWHLKPFAQVGLGKDFSSGDSAYIGAAGIRSKYSRKYQDYTFSLGNALVMAGSRLDGSESTSAFTRFDAGIEVSHPLDWTIADRCVHLGVFYIASFFADGAEVLTAGGDLDEIDTLHTVGLAFGVDRPLRLFGLALDRIGLSYVSGNGLRGVRLNTGFPF